MTQPWLTIVGIGEDGWEGLGPQARRAIDAADLLVGSERHFALIPPSRTQRIAWPSPMRPFVDELLVQYRGRAVTVLASGDPMLHGVGELFAERLTGPEYRVIPNVSAFAFVCARMGWPAMRTPLVSVLARPLERVLVHAFDDAHAVVYSHDGATPAALATLLTQREFGASELAVFERVGGPREVRKDGAARDWSHARCDDLNAIAVTFRSDGALETSLVPGLPDEAFETDGQLTKRDVRAVTLARLAPRPGELLWDVGAGTGSIGIEWMRAHPSCRAIAFEQRADRASRIAINARNLGVPGLRVVEGRAPKTFESVEPPHAVFIGGGSTTTDLVGAAWQALRPGGRLVANAVTVEGEAMLAASCAQYGGDLLRIALAHAQPIGTMHGWRPQLPVTQWIARKP